MCAHTLTWEWEQIHFTKRCRHFWTKGETQSPEICNVVTYHGQKAFVCWFGIHHCVWRYTVGNLLDINDICSGFKPFELFLFLCSSRSVQKDVFYRFFPPRKYTLANQTHDSIQKFEGIHKEHTWSHVFTTNRPRQACNQSWGYRAAAPLPPPH